MRYLSSQCHNPGPKTVVSEKTSNTDVSLPADNAAGEDEDNPKRQQILDGARKMFLSKGFEGTSMQDVARAAKVSKGTLYVYFDNKESMFNALVLKECGRMHETVRRIGVGAGPVEEELCLIARRMIEALLEREVLAAMRMMIGAAETFPDLARNIYAAGPMRTILLLGEYFELRRSQGDLLIDDCKEAGAEFVDLLLAGLQRRALLMVPPFTDAEIDALVKRRVSRFLAAYAPS